MDGRFCFSVEVCAAGYKQTVFPGFPAIEIDLRSSMITAVCFNAVDSLFYDLGKKLFCTAQIDTGMCKDSGAVRIVDDSYDLLHGRIFRRDITAFVPGIKIQIEIQIGIIASFPPGR